jgi:hypothetical protein
MLFAFLFLRKTFSPGSNFFVKILKKPLVLELKDFKIFIKPFGLVLDLVFHIPRLPKFWSKKIKINLSLVES